MAPHPWLSVYPAEIDWRAPLHPQAMGQVWQQAVAEYGKNPCLNFLGRLYTYHDVDQLVQRAMAGLQKLGVKKGTRVALCLPNTPYYVVLYYAVLSMGAVVVNLNPLYAPEELKHHIVDSGAEVIATLDLAAIYPKIAALHGLGDLRHIVVCPLAGVLTPFKSFLFKLLKGRDRAKITPQPGVIFFDQLTENSPSPQAFDVRETDLAVLQYTGGTTGVAKAAMLTHANVSVNAEQCLRWFSAVEKGRERMLAVLPFFHVFAMTAVLNLAIKAGAEIILLPRFELNLLLKTIQATQPTLFPAVPTIYTAINNAPNLGKYHLRSIKYCISGGAGLPQTVKQQFEKLSGCILVEGFGLTESSPVTHCNPLKGENRTGSIGLPLPGTMAEIVSLDDRTTVMDVGQKGELCISGPQVMAGYWKNADETNMVLKTLPDGRVRLHTGDIGIMDPDGYFRIVDRLKDMILCSGFNVYPRVVEEAIYKHPAVAEAAVVGIPDDYRGQTVKAFVQLKPGHTLMRETLIEFLRDKISPIELPKQVEFCAELPKTLIGKISKKELKKV